MRISDWSSDVCSSDLQKIAAQSAKLGKPLAEAGKGSKTIAPIVTLAERLMNASEGADDAGDTKAKGKPKTGATSLIGKFSDLKSMMPKRDRKSTRLNSSH